MDQLTIKLKNMTNIKNIAVAVASVVLFSTITNAQTLKASYSVNYEEPLKVKYLGNDENYLLFEVTLQSNAPTNTLFAISDKNEGEFYSSFLASGLKPRTFKIEKHGNDQVLNFKLMAGKKTYVKTFSVNTSVIEKVTVAENDITKL